MLAVAMGLFTLCRVPNLLCLPIVILTLVSYAFIIEKNNRKKLILHCVVLIVVYVLTILAVTSLIFGSLSHWLSALNTATSDEHGMKSLLVKYFYSGLVIFKTIFVLLAIMAILYGAECLLTKYLKLNIDKDKLIILFSTMTWFLVCWCIKGMAMGFIKAIF